MGNSPVCCDEPEIYFEYKTESGKINLYLMHKNNNKLDEKKFMEDIEKKDDKFLCSINRIIQKKEEIKNDKITFLKEALRPILPNILNKGEVTEYLSHIEKYKNLFFNIDDFIKICELFKIIYSKKKEIDREDIKYFIKCIKTVLNEPKILEDELFEYFFEKLDEIFLDNNKNSQKNPEKESEKEKNIKEDKKEEENIFLLNKENFRRQTNSYQIHLIKDGEFEVNNKFTPNTENRLDSKSKSSNFSKYSKNSQNQIKKLEEENKEYKEQIKKYKEELNEKEKNKIKIIYFDGQDEEHSIEINSNQEEQMQNIIDYFLKNNKEFIRDKGIKKIKINNKEINLEEFIDKESLSRVCTYTTTNTKPCHY